MTRILQGGYNVQDTVWKISAPNLSKVYVYSGSKTEAETFAREVMNDYSGANVSNNDIRIKAFNGILQNLGTTLKELKNKLKINIVIFFLNLRILERPGMIKVKKNKSHSSYFPLTGNQVRPTEKSITNNSTKNVFNYIKNSIGATRKEISDKSGLNEIAVQYHLKNLIEANLILKVKDGEQSHFFVLTW